MALPATRQHDASCAPAPRTVWRDGVATVDHHVAVAAWLVTDHVGQELVSALRSGAVAVSTAWWAMLGDAFLGAACRRCAIAPLGGAVVAAASEHLVQLASWPGQGLRASSFSRASVRVVDDHQGLARPAAPALAACAFH